MKKRIHIGWPECKYILFSFLGELFLLQLLKNTFRFSFHKDWQKPAHPPTGYYINPTSLSVLNILRKCSLQFCVRYAAGGEWMDVGDVCLCDL